MSQPPQNGWGQSDGSYDPGAPQGGYGQSSPNAGYGGYGQASPHGGYGQDQGAGGYAPSFGADAGYAPQPPKKSGSKLAILLCAGCAVLVLLLVLVGGGIFLLSRGGDEPTGGEDTTTQEETSGEETTEEETSEEQTTEEETSAEQTTEEQTEGGADPSALGTRENPIPVGQAVTLKDTEGGELDVTFGNVNWDATALIKETNQFNEDPGEGEVHIMVPVTVTYRGSGSVDPGWTVSTTFVGGNGNSYSEAALVVPDGPFEQGEIFDGATAEMNVPFTIPADQARTGAFQVSILLDFSGQEAWIAAE